MINFQKNLIVVKGEDKTASIQSWEFDSSKPVVYIIYSNGKSYPYNIKDVLFFENPNDIAISDQVVCNKGCAKYGVKTVRYFDP